MNHNWKTRIAEIEKAGKRRRLRTIEGRSGCELVINGISYLNFSSNNYLGLADHPDIIRHAIRSTSEWGIGTGGSRLVAGNSTLHEELEEKIASFKRQESSVLFNSGYMANLGGITAMAGKGEIIYSDARNHASIIDGARLSRARISVYNHRDSHDLEEKIRAERQTGGLIVSDGVFSMDGDITPLPELVDIAGQYNCILMIDDAHGTGTIGKTGRGVSEHFSQYTGVDVLMGTLSKSLGTEGGFIAGSGLLADLLINVARPFIFSTAMPYFCVAAAGAALDLLQEEVWRVERLSENARYLRSGLQDIGLQVPDGITPIIPVITGSNRDTILFSRILGEEGIFSPAIRPPTVPEGEGRIRVTTMTPHTGEHLEKALNAFEIAGKKTGIL